MGVPLSDAGAATSLKTGALNLKELVTHVFSKRIVESMANDEIFQILVFVLFFGTALGRLHDSTACSLLGPRSKSAT